MRVAVLGMGRMGQALAGRLLDGGQDVIIWNRTPGRAPDLVARGASERPSVAAAATEAQVVITSVANDDAVTDVAFGEDGLRAALGEGSVYVEASTISPALCRRLDADFARFVAMPILGSPAAVSEGKATYLLGGQPKATAIVDPLLPCLSNSIRRYESPPLASTAKLAVNLLLLDGIVALAESITVGRSGGLNDTQIRELLADSPMLAPGLKPRFEGVLTGHLDPWWSTALGAKDARLAVESAAEGGADLAVTACAERRYEEAAAAGLEDEDIVSVARLYRR
jgi:3-hydroxyisobutyrate dehydrogenase